jgi:hypothetical protein
LINNNESATVTFCKIFHYLNTAFISPSRSPSLASDKCQVRPWIVLHETTSLADMKSGRLDAGAVRHPVAMGKPSWVLLLLLGSSASGRKCSPVSRGTRSFLFLKSLSSEPYGDDTGLD